MKRNLIDDAQGDCSWTITTPIDGILKLTISEFRYEAPTTKAPNPFSFFDSMPVEDVFGKRKKRSGSSLCDDTFIEIFDGSNDDFSQIGDKICGDSGTNVISSTSNSLFIRLSFKTTSTLDAFKITYTLASKN